MSIRVANAGSDIISVRVIDYKITETEEKRWSIKAETDISLYMATGSLGGSYEKSSTITYNVPGFSQIEVGSHLLFEVKSPRSWPPWCKKISMLSARNSNGELISGNYTCIPGQSIIVTDRSIVNAQDKESWIGKDGHDYTPDKNIKYTYIANASKAPILVKVVNEIQSNSGFVMVAPGTYKRFHGLGPMVSIKSEEERMFADNSPIRDFQSLIATDKGVSDAKDGEVWVDTAGHNWKPQSPKLVIGDVVHGGILCPAFLLDKGTAHLATTVSDDGTTITNKRRDGPPGQKTFTKYTGAAGNTALPRGRTYFEVAVGFTLLKQLGDWDLVFEVGLARWDDIDMDYFVGNQKRAISLYAAHDLCPTHKGRVCLYCKYDDVKELNTSICDNLPGKSGKFTVGVLLDTAAGKCVIVNITTGKELVTVDGVDVAENFYPVLGISHPRYVSVELTLNTGTCIKQLPAILHA